MSKSVIRRLSTQLTDAEAVELLAANFSVAVLQGAIDIKRMNFPKDACPECGGMDKDGDGFCVDCGLKNNQGR